MEEAKKLIKVVGADSEGQGTMEASQQTLVAFGILTKAKGGRWRLIGLSKSPIKATRKAFHYQLKHLENKVQILRFYPAARKKAWPWTQSMRNCRHLFLIGQMKDRDFCYSWASHTATGVRRWLTEAIPAGIIDPRSLAVRVYKYVATLNPMEFHALCKNPHKYQRYKVGHLESGDPDAQDQ